MSSSLVPDSLLRQVVATYAPRRVILFGSRARGDARPDSDLDLLVVLDDDAPEEALGWERRAEARRGHHDVDIIPWREGDLRRREHLRGSLAATIRREGVTVYEDAAKAGEERPVRDEERVTAAEEARLWVGQAHDDREAAELMLGAPRRPLVLNAAFNVQQAAETLVKALLVLADKEVPKSHDLARLLGLLGAESPVPADLSAGLGAITGWVVTGRYPTTRGKDRTPDAEAVVAALALVARLDAIVAEALDKAGG